MARQACTIKHDVHLRFLHRSIHGTELLRPLQKHFLFLFIQCFTYRGCRRRQAEASSRRFVKYFVQDQKCVRWKCIVGVMSVLRSGNEFLAGTGKSYCLDSPMPGPTATGSCLAHASSSTFSLSCSCEKTSYECSVGFDESTYLTIDEAKEGTRYLSTAAFAVCCAV